jgi:hypothetical protein
VPSSICGDGGEDHIQAQALQAFFNISNIRTLSFNLFSTMANPEEPSAPSPASSIPYRQNAAEHIRELSRVNAVRFPDSPIGS